MRRGDRALDSLPPGLCDVPGRRRKRRRGGAWRSRQQCVARRGKCGPTARTCLCDARHGIDRERAMSLVERPMMNVDEAIRLRRSVRGFLPREVSEATLREIFALAQYSPSNCNVQPWTPHVVSGEKLKRVREALVAAGVAAGART